MYKDGAWVDWSEHIAGLAAPDEPSLAPAGPFASYTDMLPVDNFSLKLYAEPADIPDVSYAVVEGDGAMWTKGGEDGLTFAFRRFDEAEADDTTFSHFASASVDDKAVERDKDYTATEGSVKVNLMPAYLDTLPAGEHTVTATFDDGTATAKFTVAEAPVPAADTKSSASTTTKPTSTTTSLAKTADPISLAAVAAAATAGVSALVIGRRRRR